MGRLLVVAAACAALIAFVMLGSRPAARVASVVAPASVEASTAAPMPATLEAERVAVETRQTSWREQLSEERQREYARVYADVEHVDAWLRVVERATGAPVKARVERDRGQLDPPFVPAGSCDANGWVKLRIPPADESAYRTRCVGFGSALFTLSRGHEEWQRGKVIELDREATLAVTVTTASGGPIRGVVIVATVAGSELARDANAAAVGLDSVFTAGTDEKGRAKFGWLPANAKVALRASLADLTGRASIELAAFAPGEHRELSWLAADEIDVVGRLLEADDTPLGAREVWLVRREANEHADRRLFDPRQDPDARATTDASGRFLFNTVPLGRWWIGPGAVDDGAHDRARRLPAAGVAFDVLPRAEGRELLIRVERTPAIAGRVVDASGAGVRASVHLSGRTSIVGTRVDPTQADGLFNLGPLPQGHYELIGVDANSGASSKRVVVEPGTGDVVLRIGEGAAIRGRTIDALSGAPLPAELSVLQVQSNGFVGSAGEAKSNPSFEILGLDAGTYCLLAQSGDELMAIETGIELAHGSAHDVTLALQRCARVHLVNTLSVHSFSGTVHSNGVLSLGFGVEPARPSLVRVPPGPARVEYRRYHHSELKVRDLVLASGEEVELELGEN